MATVEKDFKVKNGLLVTSGGSFGGAVVVGTPTLDSHAATKEYVDNSVGSPVVPVQSSAPSSATDGQLYLDSLTGRLNVYSDGVWIPIATLSDAEYLQQHIHDTSIGGTGLIVSQFIDAGYFDSAGQYYDAGQADTTVFAGTLDGGLAIDNFN
jgi:hypothetical protein